MAYFSISCLPSLSSFRHQDDAEKILAFSRHIATKMWRQLSHVLRILRKDIKGETFIFQHAAFCHTHTREKHRRRKHSATYRNWWIRRINYWQSIFHNFRIGKTFYIKRASLCIDRRNIHSTGLSCLRSVTEGVLCVTCTLSFY